MLAMPTVRSVLFQVIVLPFMTLSQLLPHLHGQYPPSLTACTHAQSCLTLCDPARLLCPWNFPDRNTGAGCHFLLQGSFLTQGSNPSLLRLLHWQAGSLPLHHLGSPINVDTGSLLKAVIVRKHPACERPCLISTNPSKLLCKEILW